MPIKIEKKWFIDEQGRRVLLRGVGLSGSSKLPLKPNGATHIKTDFLDHRDVSFVGRPFPLEDAEEHFSRLKHWGFNCIRMVTTWEAIEHKGPKQYDKEYLDYLEEIVKIANDYEMYIIIDPHQDIWARMCGGDGAPGWTFEKVGLDFTKFDVTGAAWLMQYKYDAENPRAYPTMTWSQNEMRLACATMFQLFFAGNDFAPSCKIDGQSAQEFLQSHLLGAFQQVANRVKDSPNLIGFDLLSEPCSGFIGNKLDGSNINFSEFMGHCFTPIDAILTGAGYPRTVPYSEFKRMSIKVTRHDEINSERVSAWLDDRECIWKKEGVWYEDENGEPIYENNDYFVKKNGKEVDFYRDYLTPFVNRFVKDIREVMPNAVIFFEGPADSYLTGEEFNLNLNSTENVVHAPHWYDVFTLGLKRFSTKASYNLVTGKPVISVGGGKIHKMFIEQIGILKAASEKFGGEVPTIIGEINLPFELSKKAAYTKFKEEPVKAWETHVKALSWYYDAVDANLLSSIIWNYTPDNDNEFGDQWNLEDFSIFSPDQILVKDWKEDINSGGRAIRGFCRPCYKYVAGVPTMMKFDVGSGTFEFEFNGDKSVDAPTIIFVPKIQYPDGYDILVSEGDVEKDDANQLVSIKIHQDGDHRVKITRL
jgi:hypothetical protein